MCSNFVSFPLFFSNFIPKQIFSLFSFFFLFHFSFPFLSIPLLHIKRAISFLSSSQNLFLSYLLRVNGDVEYAIHLPLYEDLVQPKHIYPLIQNFWYEKASYKKLHLIMKSWDSSKNLKGQGTIVAQRRGCCVPSIHGFMGLPPTSCSYGVFLIGNTTCQFSVPKSFYVCLLKNMTFHP